MKRFIFCLMFFVALISLAHAQVTHPLAQGLPYMQDFSALDHISAVYPAGWAGWQMADAPQANFNTALPIGNQGLFGSSDASNNMGGVHNYNGKIGFLNSSTYVISPVLAINTIGLISIRVKYDIMTIRNPYDSALNTRINEVILQYRIGTSGLFQNLLDTAYSNIQIQQIGAGVTTPQNTASRSIFLPSSCNNKPVVQLRWVARDEIGAGDRPSFAIDNVDIKRDLSPIIEIDPETLYYGNVQLGQSITSSTYVTNASANPASITAASIMGEAAFSLGAIPPLPYELPLSGTGSAEFPVTFHPPAGGLHEGSLVLTIGWNDGRAPQSEQRIIELIGHGIADPEIHVMPDPLHVTMSELSTRMETVTISNSGIGELTFDIDPFSFPDWLNVAPLSGMVPNGLEFPLSVSFDTSTLAPNPPETPIEDGYAYDLTITNNDPMSGLYSLPIRLLVEPLPIFVDFEGDPTSGHGPMQVGFTDLSRLSGEMSYATITGWRWDFQNDGIVDSYEQNPMFTFSAPGSYDVKLTIITSTGVQRSRVKTAYVEITNTAPVIVTPLDTINDMYEDTQWGPYYLGSIFTDPDSDPLTFSAVNSENIFVQIDEDDFILNSNKDWYGTETIQLIATDPWGASTTQTVSVTVNSTNDAPRLSIPDALHFIRNSHFTVNFGQYIHDPDNPQAELSITLFNLTAPNTIMVDYQQGVQGALTAVFSAPLNWYGTNRFRIMVNDHYMRAVAQAEFDMVALEFFTPQVATDVPGDQVNTYYQYSGQAVQFYDNTLGNPDWWLWNFGDGNTSTQKDPVHTYMLAGSYTVTLTLRNLEAGMGSEATQTVPSMFTFAGTAVYNTSAVANWNQPSYNLFGDAAFDTDMNIGGLQPVEIVVFNDEPVMVAANVSFTNTTFRPPTGNPTWGGLQFSGSFAASLSGCTIRGAEVPIRITSGNPAILNTQIATVDTLNQLGETGLLIEGEASPTLSNLEIISYRNGVVVENLSRTRVSTPTLTNVRVRNSTQSSRTDEDRSTGITVKGDADLSMDDVVVDNFDTGIRFENTSLATTTTPTLTNVRVRNSTQSIRTDSFGTIGIQISGNVFPALNDVEIEDVQTGIVYTDAISLPRETPTLTNVRVRNSTQSLRSESTGALFSNVSSVALDDCEFEGFSQGMVISTDDTRAVSTPTLTNVRVRNSTQSSRNSTSVGLDISGDVILGMYDSIVDDYDLGIRYNGGAQSTRLSTPTLTNVRVRNSTQSSRNLRTGIQLIDLIDIVMENDSIVGYHTGLEITTTESRTVSTPTLTNVRVRNSTQSTRDENVGFFLGEGVAGILEQSYVEGASVGILIAEGNQTLLIRNLIKNCEIGIRASSFSGALPIRWQEFHLTQEFMMQYPGFNFRAFDLLFTGPWYILNNTIYGYSKALTASLAEVDFINNIVWGHWYGYEPFVCSDVTLQANYNNINYMEGIYPGAGNINSDPMFIDPWQDNFYLQYTSPCIDAGDPFQPLDIDGSVSDIGAWPYLHRADFMPCRTLVFEGTPVSFTNLSTGHGYIDTYVEWDIGNDGIIDGNFWDHQQYFWEPGIYDVRLKVMSGSLVDEIIMEDLIEVVPLVADPPAGLTIIKDQNWIHLSWQPVIATYEELSREADYYLVYYSDNPYGPFDWLGSIQAPDLSYDDYISEFVYSRFYYVRSFFGTRGMLDRYLQDHPQITPQTHIEERQKSKPKQR